MDRNRAYFYTIIYQLLAKNARSFNGLDRWWDCPQLDELCVRVLDVELDQKLRGRHLLLPHLKARLLNLQTPARSFRAQLNQLWQVLFSPSGIRGSYEVPR